MRKFLLLISACLIILVVMNLRGNSEGELYIYDYEITDVRITDNGTYYAEISVKGVDNKKELEDFLIQLEKEKSELYNKDALMLWIDTGEDKLSYVKYAFTKEGSRSVGIDEGAMKIDYQS